MVSILCQPVFNLVVILSMCRFSPDYAPYGFGQWPGGLAHNAYNASQIESYTGRLNISNYLDELQLPQMLDLATKYETEIMVRSMLCRLAFVA